MAEHSENNEHMVVYVSLDASLPGPRMRVRPRTGAEGFETPVVVRNAEGVDRVEPRFVYVGDGRFVGDRIPRDKPSNVS